MNQDKIKSLLEEKIQEVFCRDDHMADSLLVEMLDDLKKLGYNVDYKFINSGNWVKDGEELALQDFLLSVKVEGGKFYVTVDQLSSSSSDPYYYQPELKTIMTESEYEESLVKLKAEFSFREKNVCVYSNGKAKVDNKWFDSVELAINTILYGY